MHTSQKQILSKGKLLIYIENSYTLNYFDLKNCFYIKLRM